MAASKKGRWLLRGFILSGTFVQEEDKNKKGVRFYGTGDRVPKTDDGNSLYKFTWARRTHPGNEWWGAATWFFGGALSSAEPSSKELH